MNSGLSPFHFVVVLLVLLTVFGLGSLADSYPRKSDQELRAPVMSAPALANLALRGRQLLTGSHAGLYEDYLNFTLMRLVSGNSPSPAEAAWRRMQILDIVRQEPKTESTFLIACFHLALGENAGDDCQAISDAGLRAMTNHAPFLMMRGYVEAVVLEDFPAAISSFEKAAALPGAPSVAGEMITALQNQTFWSDGPFSQTISWLDRSPAGDLFKEYLQQRRQDASLAVAPAADETEEESDATDLAPDPTEDPADEEKN